MHDTRFDWRPGLALIGLVLVIWLTKYGELSTGVMPGNDDMMRLSQVRDLLAGQGWYDVDQSRLVTPEGGAMHWSRIPDLFMAAIIVMLTPLLGAGASETVALMAWPMALLTVTLVMIMTIMQRLGAGTLGAAIAVFFYVVSKSVTQFWPGRIDHHGLEIMLVTVAMAALLSPRAGRWSGALAGVSVAAMIGVAIESLPYAGALIAFAGILWVIRAEREAPRLFGFGAGASLAALALYVLDAPGPGAGRAVCDAFGNFHLAALLAGGASLASLSVMPAAALANWQRRLVGGGLAGLATLVISGLVAPGCLASPYAGLDGEAARNWLANVSEARNIFALANGNRVMAFSDMGFALAGLVASFWLVRSAPPGERAGWALLAVLLLLATAVMAWQVRGYLFAHMFAALAAGGLTARGFDRWRRVGGPRALLAAAAIACLVAPTGWELVARKLFAQPPVAGEDAIDYTNVCREPAAYETLASLPAGRVIAPIDLGTSILVRTHHSVFAAPYHRNGRGIGQVTRIFMDAPGKAHGAITALEADYFVFCQGLNEFNHYAAKAPASLAQRLQDGDIPAWLEPADGLGESDGVVRVYHVREMAGGGDIS